ncbi:MAG: response regulator, partial [Gemmataceae bacterium]
SLLDRLGFEVKDFGSADAGIRWLKDQPLTRPVILLDLNMPGLTTTEAISSFRTVRPDCPILLATGTLPPEELLMQVDGYAPKPYRGEELAEQIRQVRQTYVPRTTTLASL